MTDRWDAIHRILLEHKRLDAQQNFHKNGAKWGLSSQHISGFLRLGYSSKHSQKRAFAFEMSEKSTCVVKGWCEKDYLGMFFICSRWFPVWGEIARKAKSSLLRYLRLEIRACCTDGRILRSIWVIDDLSPPFQRQPNVVWSLLHPGLETDGNTFRHI